MSRRARRFFDSFRTALDYSRPAGHRFTPTLLALEDRDVPSAPPAPTGYAAATAAFTNTTPLTISATGTPTVTSTITVSGTGTYLHDLDLTTFITHTNNADLDITLTSPSGTVVTITTDNGGTFDDVYNGTLWDDDADQLSQVPYTNSANTVGDTLYANAVVKTALTPEEALAAFRGENPNGTWTLTINDDLTANGGTLSSWKLDVSTLNGNAGLTGPQVFTNSTQVLITTAAPPQTVTSALTVSGATTYLQKLTLQTFLKHTYPGDVDMTLTSPAGTVVTITSDNAVSNDDVYNGTLWDDDADPASQVPYTAAANIASDATYALSVVRTTLTPEEALGAFIGEDPNGVWTITISDDASGDGGSLDSWKLNIFGVVPFGTPTAAAASPNVATGGGTAQTVTVTYTDNAAISAATLGTGDITVTAPGGATITPTFVGATPASGATITATYSFVPPGGAWDSADNGTYAINMVAGQVTDGTLSVPAGQIGSFAVSIPLALVVTNTNDSGAGSLRDAIAQTNAAPTVDTITFAANVTGTITLTTGALTITDAVTITGPGAAALTVSGNNASTVFNTTGAAAGAAVNVSGLTVSGGATTGSGGGFSVGDEFLNLSGVVVQNNTAAVNGGGINVQGLGFVQLVNSTVRTNAATGTGTGFVGTGGGISFFASGAALNVVNSTISGNTSNSATYGGGGIYFYGAAATANLPAGFTPGTVTITNSTISGNTALRGGGLFLTTFTGSTLLVRNSTITANTANSAAGSGGGGIRIDNGTLTLQNTVVAQNTTASTVNTNPDITAGGTVNANFSFIGTPTGGGLTLSGTSANNASGNAMLGALTDNGGPTPTHAIAPTTSGGQPHPLYNTGTAAAGLTTDQRGAGFPRAFAGAVDIGAFEFSTQPTVAAPAALTLTEDAPATPVSGVTVTDPDTTTTLTVTITAASGALTATAGGGGATVGGSGSGTLTVTGTPAQVGPALGTLAYTPTANAFGSTTITVTAVNAGGGSAAPRTIAVTVSEVNDTPTAVNDPLTAVNEDSGARTISIASLLANDATGPANESGQMLTFSLNTASAVGGTVTVSGGNVVFTPTANYNGPASFTYTVTDNGMTNGAADPLTSAAGVVSFTVTPVNDAPVVTTSGGSSAYAENDSPLVIDGGVAVSDVDHTILMGATVSITGGFAPGQDVLGFVDTANIAGAYDPGTGVLTLTGTAPVAEYEVALRSVTYANTSDNPAAARTIAFVVNDGAAPSAAATRTVTITPVNDAPVVALPGGLVTFNGGGPAVLLDGGATLGDPDSPDFGTGTLTIDITANASADDRLTIRNQGIGSGQIGVSGTSVTFGGTAIGTFSGGVGAAPLVVLFNANSSPAAAQALLQNVQFSNVSANPTAVVRTVRVVAVDGDGGTSAPATKSVAPESDPSVVTTTGGSTPYTENGAPLVIDGGVAVSDPDSPTLVGATVSITGGFAPGQDVLGFVDTANIAGAYDPGTGVLTLTGTAPVAEYEVALRSVTYANTSDNPTTATRTIAFATTDGIAPSAAATRTVTVTAVNDAPTNTVPGMQTTLEDVTRVFSTANGNAVSVADPDAGTAPVQVTLTATNGTVTLSGVSGLTFTTGDGTADAAMTFTGTLASINAALNGLMLAPTADFSGSAAIQITTSDLGNTGGAAQSNDEAVDILVTAVSDAPAGASAAVTVTEDSSRAFTAADFGFSDAIDAPSDGFAGVVVTTVPAVGTLTLSGTAVTAGQFIPVASLGGLVYTPAPNGAGTGYASFTFQVRDEGSTANGGAITDPTPNTLTFDVAGVNDEPSLSLKTEALFVNQAGPFAQSGFAVFAPGGGADEAAQVPNFAVTVAPGGEALFAVQPAIDASGRLTFTPTPGASGATTVTVTAFDGGADGGANDAFSPTRTFSVSLQMPLTGDSSGATGGALNTSPAVAAGAQLIAVGSAPGTPARVLLLDAGTGAVVRDFAPFGGFLGGLRVALADVTGDGKDDLIVGTASQIAAVAVFDGATGALANVFLPFGAFPSGAQIATGDVNGDGRADIVVGLDSGAPLIAALDGATGGLLRVFGGLPGAGGGTNMAVGDFTGDGAADVATAGGPGGNGLVVVYDGKTGGVASAFFAVPGFAGDINLGMGDVDGDGLDELVLGIQVGGTAVAGAFARGGRLAKVYAVPTGAGTPQPVAPGVLVAPAAQLALADLDGDGFADLLVSTPPGAGLSQTVALSGKTGAVIRTSTNPLFGAGSDVTAG